MVKNLFVSAICAGIAAGLLASVLQFTFVIPVLLEGELYETGARVHFKHLPAPGRRCPHFVLKWRCQRSSLGVRHWQAAWHGFGHSEPASGHRGVG